MSSTFNVQVLTEKLSKLNSSQQSIETLSRWCVSHRKKARQVVETWEKSFNNSEKGKQISLMFLANDILQNSRRKGSEFVNEFWKILPRSLKTVLDSGDDEGKGVVMRLVTIWDERKVFGSRGRTLKEEVLGKESTIPLDNIVKNLQTPQFIKTVKKDNNSLRIKLAIGCLPEKIISAYQFVHDELSKEDTLLKKCSSSSLLLDKMEKDVDDASVQGNTQGSPLMHELQGQEMSLNQCIQEIEKLEATREALVSHLKEALQEQESKLEHIRAQLHVARADNKRTSSLRRKLSAAIGRPSSDSNIANHVLNNTTSLQPATTFANSLTAEEQNKKAAAEVAARLAAMTSSAEVLSSVFSTFAQQAASKSSGLDTGNLASGLPIPPMEKRPRLDNPIQNSDIGNGYRGQPSQQLPLNVPFPPQTSVIGLQTAAQSNPPQPPFSLSLPSLQPPMSTQYSQTSGGMPVVLPFGFTPGGPMPPPPPPNHLLMSMPRSNTPNPGLSPQQQQLQSPSQPQNQQPAVPTSFYPSQGVGFFGQPPVTTVPRQ